MSVSRTSKVCRALCLLDFFLALFCALSGLSEFMAFGALSFIMWNLANFLEKQGDNNEHE